MKGRQLLLEDGRQGELLLLLFASSLIDELLPWATAVQLWERLETSLVALPRAGCGSDLKGFHLLPLRTYVVGWAPGGVAKGRRACRQAQLDP